MVTLKNDAAAAAETDGAAAEASSGNEPTEDPEVVGSEEVSTTIMVGRTVTGAASQGGSPVESEPPVRGAEDPRRAGGLGAGVQAVARVPGG